MVRRNVCPGDVPTAAIGREAVGKGSTCTAAGYRKAHDIDRYVALGPMGDAVRKGRGRKVIDPLMSCLMAECRGRAVEERRNREDRVPLKAASAAEAGTVSKQCGADALNAVLDLDMVAVAPDTGDVDEV